METTVKNSDKALSDRVVDFILGKKNRDLARLTESSIAGALGIELPIMRKAFLKEQDIALDRFLVREKLHRAIYILDENEDISIPEIGETLGFGETNQFNREFEEYLYISPHRYHELQHHPE